MDKLDKTIRNCSTMFFNRIVKLLLLSLCFLQFFNIQVGATSSCSSAIAKPTLESFDIYGLKSYEEFLQRLKTHTIGKHFELKFSRFYGKNDYLQFLGIDPENFKAVTKTDAFSFSTMVESVNSTFSEIAPKHENPQNSSHPVAMIRNSFKHLVSFDLEVDELKITLEPFLTKQASPEEFAQLALCFYNLSSDELKELYINDGLQAYPSEPYSKSAPISDEAFFKVYERYKDKLSYLKEMATNLFLEKISQDFLMALPITLKKIDLYYEMEDVIYLNMFSVLKHLTNIERIGLWGEYFANPKLLIFPQLKSFPNCQYLEMRLDSFEYMLEYLNEESNGAAKDVDLSKEKIQELSSKIGFQNLKRLEILVIEIEEIVSEELIQVKLISSLKEIKFSGYISLSYSWEFIEFIDETPLEMMVFKGFRDEDNVNVEIRRNPDTKKFDKDEFNKVYEVFWYERE